jgi:hypothetical protein
VQHYQWVEHILGVVKLQETNLYVKLPTANETTATPVWEHDIIEPFGKFFQPHPASFACSSLSFRTHLRLSL